MSGQGQAVAAAPATTTDIFAGIEAWAKSKEAEIVAFGKEFIADAETYLELGVEQLASIAGNAVLQQATQVITGQEKFSQATNSVVMQVEAAGKTIGQQTAGMLVQKAVLDAQAVVAAQPAA